MKFSANKAVAVAIVASPLLTSAFPLPNIVSWLAGRSVEEAPVAGVVERFPVLHVTRDLYPRNHTNITDTSSPGPHTTGVPNNEHSYTELPSGEDSYAEAPSTEKPYPETPGTEEPYPEVPSTESHDTDVPKLYPRRLVKLTALPRHLEALEISSPPAPAGAPAAEVRDVRHPSYCPDCHL